MATTFLAIALVVGAFFLYWLPTYIAFKNHKPNVGAIATLNFFLGWTFIGWVIAMVWAYKVDAADIYRMQQTAARPAPSETAEAEYDMTGRRTR